MSEPLEAIVGEELTSVAFGRNYVQFHFWGPCLTAFAPPSVESAGRRYRDGDQEYRNQLCALIGSPVSAAAVIAVEEIRLVFDDGAILTVPLGGAEQRGQEAAVFHADDEAQSVWVWPGQ